MSESVLTERQIALLKLAGRDRLFHEHFYLTGGTALAGFYLKHRWSEYLDFFSEDEFGIRDIDIWLKRIRSELGYVKVDYQQSYNRNLFFLHFADEKVLKTEFTYFPFPRIEAGESQYGVSVDSLTDIAVNKLFTIYQQTRARDFIDLYFICREQIWDVADLTRKAKAKFDWHIDPLQLGTQFAKATEAKDYPRMIKKTQPDEWQEFFLAEAKKLKPDVLQ